MDNNSTPNSGQSEPETNIFGQPISAPATQQASASSEQTTAQPQIPPHKKSHKSAVAIAIVAIVVIVIVIVIALIILLPKLFKQPDQINDPISIAEPAKEILDVYDNLAIDYNSGQMGVDEYFRQLVYLEIDSEKVNKDYETDNDQPGSSHRDEILNLIEKYSDKLDEDLIRQYLISQTQKNFAYGKEGDVATGDPSSIILADSEEDKRAYKIHYFDHARLSKNKHFLIWYTEEGEDKVTQAQIDAIDSTFESSIGKYAEAFGEKFNYTPEVTTANPILANSANKILRANGIPDNTWKNTMNIYVYDTKSKVTLGTWTTGKMVSNNIVYRALNDLVKEEDFLTRPYIVLNAGLLDKTTRFKQVSSHELFHHYQHSYCMANIGTYCPESDSFVYNDMTANYASALVHGSSPNSFLSEWSTMHREQIHNGLTSITDATGATGYGAFPYLAAYAKYGSNKTIMASHSQSDPLTYLEQNISADGLKKAAADSAYYVLSNDYDDIDASSDETTPVIEEFEIEGNTEISLAPGAIKFYKLDKNSTVELSGGNAVYVLIGQKGSSYQRISDYLNAKQSIKTGECSKSYETCYLAIANPSITSATKTSADYNNLDNDGTVFRTQYRNYKTKIILNISMNGIDVSSTAEGVVDELHQRQHLKQTVNTGVGVNVQSEIYTDFYHGVSYTSRPDLGLGDLSGLGVPNDAIAEWTKSNDVSAQTNLGILAQKLKNGGDNVKKIDDTHYDLKISAADLKSYMALNDSSSNVSLPNDGVKAAITVNNGYITNVKYDFSGIANIEQFTADVTFSDYNTNETVYLPFSVVHNAKEQ